MRFLQLQSTVRADVITCGVQALCLDSANSDGRLCPRAKLNCMVCMQGDMSGHSLGGPPGSSSPYTPVSRAS